MSLRQKATKGVIWSIAQKWGTQAISFLVFLVLSRLLDPQAFGVVAMALVFVALVEIFLDQGFSEAIVQRTELEPEHLDTAFWTGLLSSILLMGLGIVAAEPVAALFHEPQLVPVVRWLSLSFPIGALSSTQQAILQRSLAFKSLTLRSLAAAAIGAIVGTSMAVAGYGVWSLVGQNLANQLAGAIVLWQVSDWRPKFKFVRKHFKELFDFGLNVIGLKILDFVNRRSDDFLIGYFLGSTALGYYTIAYRLLLIVIKLLTGVTTSVAYPTFSRLQGDPERMRRAFYKVTQYTSSISFPIFLGTLVLAPTLVLALFGQKWLPSVPVMQVLSPVGILLSISYFNNTVIKASGKPDWLLKIMLINSICNAIGFMVAVRWGIVAVATAYVIVAYSFFPIYLYAVQKLIKIDIKRYFLNIFTPSIASGTMVVSLLWLKSICAELELPLQLVIYTSAGFAIYSIVILLTAQSMCQDILSMLRLAKQK